MEKIQTQTTPNMEQLGMLDISAQIIWLVNGAD